MRKIGWLLVMLLACVQGVPIHAQDDASWTLVDVRLIGDEMWQRVGEVYPDSAPRDAEGVVQGHWYALMLSPDGSLLISVGNADAVSGNDNPDPILCRYGIDSHDILCVPFDLRQTPWISSLDAAWSPDGTRIAFYEDGGRQVFDDSDIWLLDVATLAVTNLTNDGQTGLWLDIPKEALLRDFAPLWSTSGDLYFFRMTYQGPQLRTALYRLSGAAGTPEFVLDLPGDIATFQVGDLSRAAMAPGSNLHIALIPINNEALNLMGVWMIDIIDGEASFRQLVWPPDLQASRITHEESDLWLPMQVAWNADSTCLAVYMFAPGGEMDLDYMNYLVVDAETGVVTPIFDFASPDQYEALPGLGMIAPDRQGLIYVARDESHTLWSVSFDSGAISPVDGGTLPDEIYRDLTRTVRHSGFWGQTSSSGRILHGDVLLIFD